MEGPLVIALNSGGGFGRSTSSMMLKWSLPKKSLKSCPENDGKDSFKKPNGPTLKTSFFPVCSIMMYVSFSS